MKFQKIKNIIQLKLNGIVYNFDTKMISIVIEGPDGTIYDIDRYFNKNLLKYDVYKRYTSSGYERILYVNFKEFL